jgi:Zn-dependent protease
MNNETIAKILLFVAPLLFSISFHEAAHAYMANKKGDPTAKDLGRLTLNPLAHIDIFGTIILPALLIYFGGPLFGYAKPVPVNPVNLKNYKNDNLMISLAGPISNLMLAIAFAISIKIASLISPVAVNGYFFGSENLFDQPIIAMLNMGILLNIGLMLFNLLPIPPLDGFHVLEGILPERYNDLLEKYNQVGFFVFIILYFTGILNYIGYPITLIYTSILRIIL